MKNLAKNRLLINCVLFLALYWIFAPMVAKPYVRNTMSILSLVSGVVMLHRYWDATYRILFKQDRDETGAHYAVFGAAIASIGVIYTGTFSILWVYFGQPSAWSATASSSFGSGLIAIGLWLMTISPDTVRVGGGYPIGFWRTIIAVFSLLLAFLAGTHFASM